MSSILLRRPTHPVRDDLCTNAALLTTVDDVSRPKRKRTIMGRYVFGDELKPGEHWKRRLSKGR